MTYRLSAKAEADLTDIWSYSAEQWGVDRADRYVDALLRRFSWLPEKFAKKGRIVELKTEHGWDDGWEVIQVFDGRVKAAEMKKRQDDYKNTRKASDI